MYLSLTKRKNIAILAIAIACMLTASSCSIASAGDFNILLSNITKDDFFNKYANSEQLCKLLNNTTIDPELQLALDASYRIESDSGKWLVGDSGKSIGPLHIQKQAIDDVNRILNYTAFSYDDRMSWEKSCQIFRIYLKHYGQKYSKEIGKKPTVEVYIRIWNGGPNGWKSNKTKSHWLKAQEVIF